MKILEYIKLMNLMLSIVDNLDHDADGKITKEEFKENLIKEILQVIK